MIFGHGIEQGSNALRAAPVGFVDEQKSVLPDGLLGGLLQLVGAVSAGVMALFVYLAEKKHITWVENFSIAGSMLAGMAAAVLVGLI